MNAILFTAVLGVVSTVIALFVGSLRGAKNERANRAMEEIHAHETAFRVGDKVDAMSAAERRERLGQWAKR